MRNFDAFLTGQPSYSTQIKFWLQLVLRIKTIIFEYPGGPSTMKKDQNQDKISNEKNYLDSNSEDLKAFNQKNGHFRPKSVKNRCSI